MKFHSHFCQLCVSNCCGKKIFSCIAYLPFISVLSGNKKAPDNVEGSFTTK